MTRDQALLEIARREAMAAARSSMLAFMRWNWWMPGPLHVGRHTRAICSRITRAIDDLTKGISTFLVFEVPFRHGKSDIVSRAMPAYALGRLRALQPDLMMTGYGATLSQSFSRQVKRIMVDERYQVLFPGVRPGYRTNSASQWKVEHSAGEVNAFGMQGGLTGKGYMVGICDDFCKNIEEARSLTFRDKAWEGFTKNFLTRRHDPCVTVLTATPWHVDDVIGRIIAAMKADENFPRFEFHCFPASKPGPDGWQYLFPEHFSPQWYDGQRATLGRGMSAALLDLNPVFEGGNRFDVRKVILHETKDGWPTCREVRFWDPASSSAQRDKSDPDWTWGTRGTITKDHTPYGDRLNVWVSAMTACRDEAPRRNELIRQTAKADGPTVSQFVENWGGYKDAYTDLKEILRGICIVNPSRLPGDKSAKAAILEPAFDNAAVHVYLPGCRDVLEEWKRQFEEFPNSTHDDAVDATSGMAHSVNKTAVTLMV